MTKTLLALLVLCFCIGHATAQTTPAADDYNTIFKPLKWRSIGPFRGGRSVALTASLVILVAYYLVLTVLEGMTLRQRLPAALAIWAPNVGFSVMGLALLLSTAREWTMPSMTVVWRALHGLDRLAPRRAGAASISSLARKRAVR